MSRRLKELIKTVLKSPIGKPLSHLYQGQGTCLMYHRIIKDPLPPHEFNPNAELLVTADNFEKQIKYLSENYRCLDISTAISKLENGDLPSQCAIVTFDDGYKDNLTLALPILRKYRVPAAIYLTSGFIDRTSPIWWYEHECVLKRQEFAEILWKNDKKSWSLRSIQEKTTAFKELNQIFKSLPPAEQDKFRQMLLRPAGDEAKQESSRFHDQELLTWDEVRILAKEPLLTIGAHTQNHFVLSQLTETQVEDEIKKSKIRIEENIGREIHHFAYPFGDKAQASHREFEITRNLGFRSALTTRPGHLHPFHKQHLFSLPRMNIGYFDSLSNFQWKLSGLDSMIHNPLGVLYNG